MEKEIEIEIKFQPTQKQLDNMLQDAKELSVTEFRDVYFDFKDFRFLKKDIRLRCRKKINNEKEMGGFFELKARVDSKADLEIKNEEEIKKYLGIGEDFKEFIKKLIVIIDFKTKRKKYTKGGFIIDVDELDFGSGQEKYKVCEIEVMIRDEKQIKETRNEIKEFAKRYNFDVETKVIPKGFEYLRRFNFPIYEKIYLAKQKLK